MHIAEGVLSAPVIIGGIAAAAAGCTIGIRQMDSRRMPAVALLSASFFVASLIHVPIGPANVHLSLGGLLGLLLGWSAFPAMLVALGLQAALFQFGGLTTLGINTFNMALPAVLCYYLFRPLLRGDSGLRTAAAAFLSGFTACALSLMLLCLSLIASSEGFMLPAKVIILGHLPVMLIEGIITAGTVAFLKKVQPELLEINNAQD